MDRLAPLTTFQGPVIIPFASPVLIDLDWTRPVPRPDYPTPPAPRPQRHIGGLAPWQIKRVSAYVDAHLAERTSLADVAAQVRLSTSHFSRGFRKSFGLPFLRFLASKRIAYAQVLMMASDRPLCDIALSCGFADQSHFSRTFSRLAGEPPAQWRRQGRQAARHGRRAMAEGSPFRDAASAPQRAAG